MNSVVDARRVVQVRALEPCDYLFVVHAVQADGTLALAAVGCVLLLHVTAVQVLQLGSKVVRYV